VLEIRIHGYGGQGTVTLAELVAFTQLKLGKHVQTLPFFGMERRGAPVRTAMRLSDSEIMLRSQVYQPHLLVSLSDKLVPVALQQGLHPQGAMLVNCGRGSEGQAGFSGMTDQSGRSVPVCCVDAWGIARAHNLVLMGQPLINVPMFGAMAKVLGLSEASVAEGIAYKWSVGNEISVEAALRGYTEVRGAEELSAVLAQEGRLSA